MAFLALIQECVVSIISFLKPPKQVTISQATEFNREILQKLQNEYQNYPEVNFAKVFPERYSRSLDHRKMISKNPTTKPTNKKIEPSSSVFIPLALRPTGDLNVIFPISHIVLDQYPISSASDLAAMLEVGETIWKLFRTYVIKYGTEFVVKINNDPDTTAFSSMSFLEQCSNSIPASKALGMVIVGEYTYLFMSYVKGVTLDKVWDELKEGQKEHIQTQLDDILVKLRGLPRPEGCPLGGVMGEGCKDVRRTAERISQTPIHSVAEFEDFVFSNPLFGSSIWINHLRQMTPKEITGEVVFTHGDFRAANIKVELDGDKNYQISGIIDWEGAGFYPWYWEFLKALNILHDCEKSDWFLHLPKCIKPEGIEQRWLLDHIWTIHIVGC
ncbi:hypothetical protein K3495_g6343 [Podosphaera aphanis]|nr:hypothetical protein K3495_g6343 [Podosphaera aphanis]